MCDVDPIPHASGDPSRVLLRHTLATLAYRAGKPLRDAPAQFSEFRPAPGSRAAGEILAHMCDLFDWALALAEGEHRWSDVPPREWSRDCGIAAGRVGASQAAPRVEFD